MTDLTQQHCVACEAGVPPLNPETIQTLLSKINDWAVNDEKQEIVRDFHFKNYCQTMAFVNAIAWIAHQEKHHPDLEVGYNHCKVRYSTHAIGGLSENDFICAAKVDRLVKSNG